MTDETLQERIEKLTDAGLLTEKQAEVYIRRDIELEPRGAVADYMGISENVHDKHLRAARDKVEAAEDTILEIESQRDERTECVHCGAVDEIDHDVTVRVEQTEQGEHYTVCNICEPPESNP